MNLFKQFSTFAVVGAIGTSGHYLTLLILVEYFMISPIIASTAGFSVGAVINYFLNYFLTFKSSRRHREAMPRFILFASIGALLNALLMQTGITMGMNYLFAQIFATAMVLGVNFYLNRRWTFSEIPGREIP